MAVRAARLFTAWRQLIQAHGDAQAAVRASTRAMLEAAWRHLDDPYDSAGQGEFATAAAAAVARGRSRSTDLMGATLKRALDEADVKPPRVRLVTADKPRGLLLVEEMYRPGATWRYELSRGVSDADARERALVRAATIAEMDLALASRDAFEQYAAAAPEILGHRRVLHPELSTGGSCGLCIAAATRVYKKADLMPLHDRCHCVPWPILSTQSDEDLVQRINGADLDELYLRIGETSREALKKVRFTVEDHGELGPTLREAGHDFRDHADAVRDADDGTPIGAVAA